MSIFRENISLYARAYQQKLKDPRWKALRLLILDRDLNTCQGCGEENVPLEVHHQYYLRGREPWDYPDDAMTSLCRSCMKAKLFRWTLKPMSRRRSETSCRFARKRKQSWKMPKQKRRKCSCKRAKYEMVSSLLRVFYRPQDEDVHPRAALSGSCVDVTCQ